MNKLFLTFSLLIFISINSFAQYKGRVYIDNNANGILDKGDTPVKDVVVSDGQNVVKTNKDGKFSLPGYERTRFIQITKPVGYAADKFYLPVNNNTTSYDFILKIDEKARKQHSFIQITDTEIHNNGVGSWAEILRKYIAAESPDFLIHTGDICYESGLKNHIKVVNTETMGCPVYYMIGNHDLTKGEYGEQLFESIYGPTWFSFDYGNVHYVVTPMKNGDHKPAYTIDEVCRWLKNDLAMMDTSKNLVVFNHDILTTGNDFLFGAADSDKIDLRNFNLVAWIYGHWHYNYVRNQDGVYTICTNALDKGGIDHSASAFRVMNFDENDNFSAKLKYCFIEPTLKIVSPFSISNDRFPLLVNAYQSGGEVKNITYHVEDTDGKTIIPQKQLKKKSDWTWSNDLLIPDNYNQINIYVKTYLDGRELSDSLTVNINKKIPEIRLSDNWSTLLGNAAHTGKNTADINLPLIHKWTQNVGQPVFMSSPIIANGKIYVATINDNADTTESNRASICCLDTQTGTIEWTYKTRNSVKNSIAYDSGKIFAQDADGWLYAVNSANGQVEWEKQLIQSFPYVSEGLTAVDGVVYAGSGESLTAFKAQDGSVIWKNTDWKKNESSTTTIAVGEGVVVSGSQWGALYSNDAVTGKMLWKLTADGLSNRGASATFHDGKIYIISGNHFFIINPKTGEIENKKEVKDYNLDVTSTPLITDDNIVFGTFGRGILSLDKELFPRWNTPTGQSLVFTAPYSTVPSATVETSPVLVNGIIYFGASDGNLYGLKQNTGEIVWKKSLGAPVFASVAVSGNVLIAADFGGNVYCFAGM